MAIRLNPDQIPDLLLSIQQSRQNLNTATRQLSTGRSVNALSDDAAAVAQLVRNHDQAGQDDQFLKNQSTLQSQFQSFSATATPVDTAPKPIASQSVCSPLIPANASASD